MASTSDKMIISQPALGQDVQLGMLYDARSSQFFAGISLWDNEDVNGHQKLDDKKIQNADFKFSHSLEEARRNSSLSIEGSLSLDLKILTAMGSARYLNDEKSSLHEARVDVSCNIVRRTRRIPQETLHKVKYGKYLDDLKFTHYVGEVVEGGSATLSFVRSCSSAEEAKKLTGELKISIAKIPVSGSAKVELSDQEISNFENVKISYSGAIVENVCNLQDALRVAGEMPKKLAKQLNTLSYKLLPLSVLDSKADRLIRTLDDGLVINTAAALKAGNAASLKLKDLLEQEVFQTQFPAIKNQIYNFQTAFSAAETEFAKNARRLLPELRDGNTNANEKLIELQSATDLFKQRTKFAEEYINLKNEEAEVLRKTVTSLLASKFENYLGGIPPQSLVEDGSLRLLLSFGGPSIGGARHPLQQSIELASSGTNSSDTGKIKDDYDDDDDSDDNEEWFESQQTVAAVKQSCSDLKQQRLLTISGVTVLFGVASIDKAYRPGKTKKTKTRIGDIILDSHGKLLIVTGMLPKAPEAPGLCVQGQSITVTWLHERQEPEESTIPTTGFVIRYRRQPNPIKDGAFPRTTANEPFVEVTRGASDSQLILESLSDDCDYEVAVSVLTIVGASPWSVTTRKRTEKLTSVASEMIDFFNENSETLSKSTTVAANKPWELHSPTKSNGKKTLFLGVTEVDRHILESGDDPKFKDEIAVRIVDVAVEFKPEIKPAPIEDSEKTIVAVFTGSSGHGKSTQINAFISYLFGGEVDDPVRVMVIDDRGAQQAASVTQIVTCFRVRPLSPLFQGKTLLIVDTPGYGDSRGPERDSFVTAAMSKFFERVSHVNVIIFTCRANETRTTFLHPISTYVFSLFAKDVRSCLRTVYTFSDAGEPQARDTLVQLGWPVHNGEIAVNNSAFTVNLDGSAEDFRIRESWLQSIKGQFRIMHMLQRAPSVSTKSSASVTKQRILLEQKCELAEKKILSTANEARNLISDLDSLAQVIGISPGDKITVIHDKATEKPLPPGRATTLCLQCNFTCHDICDYSDDEDKRMCVAMVGDYCTFCPKKCHWKQHKNAQFLIVIEKISVEMVPEDLINKWNECNKSLEGALLNAMKGYLRIQEELRKEILILAKLSEELTNTALLHDPTGLINYIDTLMKTAKAAGASVEQLVQLSTARKTLILLRELKGKGEGVTRDSNILLEVMGGVSKEMERRMKLSARERAEEEEKPCSLYNELRERLPADIRYKAPAALSTRSRASKGAPYSQNLKAVVGLVHAVLVDGGVVAALAVSTE